MIVGTAGHIDHGKTSLVKVITGIDADRLKEEKERGITIDLGFAYWERPEGAVVGFVDVPGHERFVHTMLAGAQSLDLVMLVIAVDDGIMPQTREHLELVCLLGLDRALVALTKIDAVTPERVAAVAAEIDAWLADTPLAGSSIFPVSSLTGEGLPALVAALDVEQGNVAARVTERLFRLSVDRCFTLQGAGVVVTGMVLDGQVAVGDEVVVSPSGLTARIRSLHAQNRKAQIGRAGDRCALNLAGPDIAKDAISRGDMIVAAASHAPSTRIDAEITVAPGATKGLTQWMPARLHHATTEVGARIVLLGDGTPKSGERTRVQLVLDQPIAARALDRFVLRDVSASRTLAGGRLLDLRPPDRKRRTPERLAVLDAISEPDPVLALARLVRASAVAIDLDAFARDRGGDADLADRWCDAAGAVIFIAGRQRFALSRDWLEALRERLAAALVTFHAANPDLSGTGLERLRLQTAAKTPAPLFRALLRGFAGEGSIVIDGNWVRLASHQVEFSLEEENLWQEIGDHLAGPERFRPPRVRDIANQIGEAEEDIRRLFRRLGRSGEIDEVAQDHFLLRRTLGEIVAIAAGLEVAAGGWFTAALLRDALEVASGATVGRKVVIQILEFLDRHGVTIRRGDQRRINPHRRDLFSAIPANETGAAPAGSTATMFHGRESSLVGRPDFKSGWGRETVSGGFDCHSLPPQLHLETKRAGHA